MKDLIMKKNYIKPTMSMVELHTESPMALSVNTNETPYDGTAGAKGNFTFTFEEEALPEDPTKTNEEEDWDDEEEDL